ncbi:MAG: hypothetical protein CAF44_011780 [Nitrospira sp. CG24D]|jgi:hypothetical protein|nr:MAG: hypothetical protein CAF44_011780 [Nitrospira sp. CG24D]
MHDSRRVGQVSRLVVLLACLLACIQLVAGVVCSTCFNEFEQPPVRTFYLHSGGDHHACHHGRAQLTPLVAWACTVTQDEGAFILPEIPRLPVVVSVFVPLVLLLVSYRTLLLIAAHGRGPPVSFS